MLNVSESKCSDQWQITLHARLKFFIYYFELSSGRTNLYNCGDSLAVHPHWPFNEKPAGDFRLQIFYVVMLLSARKQADLDPDHSSFSIFGVVSKCFLFRAHHFIIVLPSLADGSENQVPNVNIYLPQSNSSCKLVFNRIYFALRLQNVQLYLSSNVFTCHSFLWEFSLVPKNHLFWDFFPWFSCFNSRWAACGGRLLIM